MIDLLKNYKQLHNVTGYAGSLRYFLAKKKMDTLFIKWLSSNRELVSDLIARAEKGTLKASNQPNPLFSNHRVPRQDTSTSVINFPSINTPQHIEERSQVIKRRGLNQTQTLTQSTILTKPITKQIAEIPRFYFPTGKPIDSIIDASNKSEINTIIGDKTILSLDMVQKLTVNLVGLPIYFYRLFIQKAIGETKGKEELQNTTTITRVQFNRLWKELQGRQLHRRAFMLLSCSKRKDYLLVQDFMKLLRAILELHPTLDFLKDTPNFQEYYSIYVINRMYYMANRKQDYKMNYREFKNSQILQSLFDIQAEHEINKNADFFSYQDFYVIYVKFWQLDYDHDFFLTKEQLSKYSGYTLSRKTVERIFSQTVKKFQDPEKMTFGDFIWFIICVEDKSTEQSITFWFNIMDLDANGIITGYQIEHFYEEQRQRLEYMEGSNPDFNIENIVCQMADLFKPKNHIQFTLKDFLSKKTECGAFINMLTDLNKLVNFEQRDAYEERSIKVDNPNWSEWDRFVKPEYKRIEANTQNEEGGEVLNWENDDE